MSIRLSSWAAAFMLSLCLYQSLDAQTVLTVAAAADLAAVEPQLKSAFEKAHPGLGVRFVNGASAVLAQQIEHGAPFDIFLSANVDLVDRLHLADARTYAVGHVAILWKDNKAHPLSYLTDPAVRFVALPNPQLAPYGLAAEQALRHAGLWDQVEPKMVYAENVRQTLQLFESGNTEAVLTALSLVVDRNPQQVPTRVIQKGGLVRTSKQLSAAQLFMSWLISPDAQEILARYGFDKP